MTAANFTWHSRTGGGKLAFRFDTLAPPGFRLQPALSERGRTRRRSPP